MNYADGETFRTHNVKMSANWGFMLSSSQGNTAYERSTLKMNKGKSNQEKMFERMMSKTHWGWRFFGLLKAYRGCSLSSSFHRSSKSTSYPPPMACEGQWGAGLSGKLWAYVQTDIFWQEWTSYPLLNSTYSPNKVTVMPHCDAFFRQNANPT